MFIVLIGRWSASCHNIITTPNQKPCHVITAPHCNFFKSYANTTYHMVTTHVAVCFALANALQDIMMHPSVLCGQYILRCPDTPCLPICSCVILQSQYPFSALLAGRTIVTELWRKGHHWSLGGQFMFLIKQSHKSSPHYMSEVDIDLIVVSILLDVFGISNQALIISDIIADGYRLIVISWRQIANEMFRDIRSDVNVIIRLFY